MRSSAGSMPTATIKITFMAKLEGPLNKPQKLNCMKRLHVKSRLDLTWSGPQPFKGIWWKLAEMNLSILG